MVNRLSRHRFGILVALGILVLAWQVKLAIQLHPLAVTGNDPATYVAVAHSLATLGTVTRDNAHLELATSGATDQWIFVPPGYAFVAETQKVVPVFALGLPILLSFADRLGGIEAMLWVMPLLGAGVLALVGLISLDLFELLPRTRRLAIGVLGMLLLATNFKQITLVLIPMSDVAAQFFCLLALFLALKTKSRGAFGLAILTGISLGAAYWMRHTAILMLLPVTAVLWYSANEPRRRAFLFTLTGAALFATVVPDLVYHILFLGGVLRVESPGSETLNWQNVPQTAWLMVTSLLSVKGFGPLGVFAIVGGWALWVWRARIALGVLGIWLGSYMLFHLPLRLTALFENELRYLIPAFPALGLLIAVGVVYVFQKFQVMASKGLTRRVAGVFGMLLLVMAIALTARFWFVTPQITRSVYGWVGREGQENLERLPSVIPADAVVAATEQAVTAIGLYANRDTVPLSRIIEPDTQFLRLETALRQTGRPLYLVGDPDCSPDMPASYRLPDWTKTLTVEFTGQTLSGVTEYCTDKIYRLK